MVYRNSHLEFPVFLTYRACHRGVLMTKTETKPTFEIKNLDDLKRVLTIARGGDPDAIQAVAKFMNLDSPVEGSYFPDKMTSLAIAQLNIFGKSYYPNDDWNPYSMAAEKISEGFKGFKGFKSNQFMEMTRQTPNLSSLQATPDEVRKGFLSRIFGGKSE